MTPPVEAPIVPQEQVKKQPTPQEVQDGIINGILEKYGVDLKTYTCNNAKCSLGALETELKTTSAEKIIEERIKELYKAYLNEELQKQNGVEKVVSLDAVSKSVESERLEDMRNEFEKVLNPVLKKYDFLDKQTKEFIKLGIANSMLKGPNGQILDSLVGSFSSFMTDLSKMDPKGMNNWLENKEKGPKDSGRTLSLEEQFSTDLKKYLDKFEEINKKLNEVTPKLTEIQKQNIISNVDWFRNPALIEAGVEGLDLKIFEKDEKGNLKTDLTKLEKKELNEDEKKNLVEYMMKSRENLVDLSKKMALGDKGADLAYGLIGNGGEMGEGVEKILEMILDLPIVGKIFAMFLGLDPNNAKEELKENSSNFKYLSSLKSLGVSKNEKAEKIPGKEPFKDIDLSDIRFNIVKKEIKEVKEIFGEDDEENLSAKWQEAFTTGITTPDGLFKLEKGDDKKITSSKLKEILKTGLGEYNNKKEEMKVQEENKKRAEEPQKLQEKLGELNTKKIALDYLNGKEESIFPSFIDRNVLGDSYDFKNIKLANTKDLNNIDSILKGAIGEGVLLIDDPDYEQLGEIKTQQLKEAIKIILNFLQTNSNFKLQNSHGVTIPKPTIGDIMENSHFRDFINTQITQNNESFKSLESEKGKIELSEIVGKKIMGITTETKLSTGIELGNGKKIKITDGKLTIGNEIFEMTGGSATLKDIVIDGSDNVKIEGIKYFIPGSTEVSKKRLVDGLHDLIIKGEFNFKDSEGTTIRKVV